MDNTYINQLKEKLGVTADELKTLKKSDFIGISPVGKSILEQLDWFVEGVCAWIEYKDGKRTENVLGSTVSLRNDFRCPVAPNMGLSVHVEMEPEKAQMLELKEVSMKIISARPYVRRSGSYASIELSILADISLREDSKQEEAA